MRGVSLEVQEATVTKLSCGDSGLAFFRQSLTCSATKCPFTLHTVWLNVTSYLPFFFSRLFIGSEVFQEDYKVFSE